MSDETIKNTNRECRLCLQNSEVYFNLLEGNFPQLMKELTSLEIREDDDYPKFGCTTCIFEMQSAVKVRNRILECYKKLVELKKKKVAEGVKETGKTFGTIYIVAKVAKNTITEHVAILTSAQPSIQVGNVVNPKNIGIEIPEGNETSFKTGVEIKKNVETTGSNVCSASFNSQGASKKNDIETEHNYAKPIEADSTASYKKDVNVVTEGGAENCNNSKMNSKKVLTIDGNYEFIHGATTRDHVNNADPLSNKSVETTEEGVEKRHICDDCGESFRNKRAFEFHITKHNKTRCKRCYLIIDSSQVQSHKDFHDNDPRICNYCGKTIKNETCLRKHIFAAHMPKIYVTCDHCPEGFRLKSELKKHMKEIHDVAIVKDGECSSAADDCDIEIVAEQRKPKKKIVQIQTEKRYICPDCNENCHSRRSFDAHISKHNKSRCKKCSLVIETENLDSHMDSHINDPKVCHLCGALTKNEMALRVHLSRIHSSKVNFKCNHCSEGFRMKSQLKSHMREVHPEVVRKKEGPRICEVCGKEYKHKQALMHHVYYVHKLKHDRYKCDKCTAAFRTKSEVEKHKFAVHEGIRNNTCHICGKTFIHPWDTERHIRVTHMKIRPHICEYCKKGCSTAHTLKTHLLTHTKERPFKCHICGKGLTQVQKLRYHLKSVHNIQEEENFPCKFCDKSFISNLGLKLHLRSHVNTG